MPTIKRRTDIPANGVVSPLVGSQYEYLPFDAMVEFAILADAGDDVNASVFSGSDVLLQNERLDEKALTEAVQYPWDYDIQDVAAAGERLGVQLQENAGLAATVRTVVRITPL